MRPSLNGSAHCSKRDSILIWEYRCASARNAKPSSWGKSKPGCRRSTASMKTASSVISSTRLMRSSSRSEEHTSELQSHLNLVCRLLLEKKIELTCCSSRHEDC